MSISKTFGAMQSNVGNNVTDTSTAFATKIGEWIHNRYFDILRRINWQAIDDDYSFTLSAGITLVTLPSDFGKEVSVYDATNNEELDFISSNDLITTFPDTIGQSGDVNYYTIIDTINDSGQRYKYFKPHQVPVSDGLILMPYHISPTTLASAGAITVIPCEDIIELGATADAWRSKRQFAKAADIELLYERGIQNLIWEKENQANQIKTFNVSPYSRETV